MSKQTKQEINDDQEKIKNNYICPISIKKPLEVLKTNKTSNDFDYFGQVLFKLLANCKFC